MIAREASNAADKMHHLSCLLDGREYMDIKKEADAFCRQAYELERTAKNTIPAKQGTGFDKFLGKNLMGIFAAILIFTGAVLAGMAVFPLLGNYGKAVCLFIISVCMFIPGIIFLKKHPGNKFYLSLAGIGAGLLFLLFVMSGTYLNICSYQISCLLIFAWSFLLNRLPLFCKWIKYNVLFLIIGRTSLYISICSGVFVCIGAGKLSILILYLLLMIIDYYKTRYSNGQKYYSIPCHVLHFLSNAVIVASVCIQYKPMLIWYGAMFMVFLCMVIEFVFSIKENKSNPGSVIFHLLTGFYTVLCVLMVWRVFGSGIVFPLASYAICFAVLAVLENVFEDNINAARIILFFTMAGVLLTNKITGGLIFIVLIHMAGFYYISFSSKQTKIYPYFVAAATYAWTIFYVLPNMPDLYCIISAAACLVTYVFAGFDDTDKYAINVKYLAFLTLLSVILYSGFHDFGIIRVAGFTMDQHIWLCLLIFIHIMIILSKVFSNAENRTMLCTISDILVFTGLYNIAGSRFPVILMAMVFWLIVIGNSIITGYFKSSHNNQKYKDYVYAYCIAKYVLLVIASLYMLGIHGMGITTTFIIAGMCGILYGFRKNYNAAKIYGLIFLLYGICCFISSYIWIKNTMSGAAGFIVCGVLCLVINFLYNKTKKR